MGSEPLALKRRSLVDEWRAASAYYEELEVSDAGAAARIECRELDPQLAPLADELRRSAPFIRTFDNLPATVAMVELAPLVVCQNHVTRSFVDRLKASLGPHPDPAALFRFCLPLEASRAPVQICEVGSKRYVFRCESTDFRFHEALLLRPEQLRDYAAFGEVAGVVGLVLAFAPTS